MKTPIELLLTVTNLDGRLSTADDKLRVLLPADCPPELKGSCGQGCGLAIVGMAPRHR